MNPQEITELLELKGWSESKLASELDLSQYAVRTWLQKERTPSGPASKLMRMWLNEARRSAKKSRAS